MQNYFQVSYFHKNVKCLFGSFENYISNPYYRLLSKNRKIQLRKNYLLIYLDSSCTLEFFQHIYTLCQPPFFSTLLHKRINNISYVLNFPNIAWVLFPLSFRLFPIVHSTKLSSSEEFHELISNYFPYSITYNRLLTSTVHEPYLELFRQVPYSRTSVPPYIFFHVRLKYDLNDFIT